MPDVPKSISGILTQCRSATVPECHNPLGYGTGTGTGSKNGKGDPAFEPGHPNPTPNRRAAPVWVRHRPTQEDVGKEPTRAPSATFVPLLQVFARSGTQGKSEEIVG